MVHDNSVTYYCLCKITKIIVEVHTNLIGFCENLILDFKIHLKDINKHFNRVQVHYVSPLFSQRCFIKLK